MADLVRQAAASPEFQQFVFTTMGASGSDCGAPEFTWDGWIREHFLYRVERDEVVRTPAFMLDEFRRTGFFEGDCDCVSVFYATVIQVLGYPVRFVAIRFSDPFEFEHVFCEYNNSANWIRVDVTVPPGTIHKELERMEEYV